MARYLGPKNKLARREGVDLGLKTIGSSAHQSMLRRLNVPPGVHGQRGRRKLSDYGVQLREKQKAKRIYGVSERSFHNYYKRASKIKQATGEVLLQLLERRLDNVIFRLGFAPTRSSARQLVAHGHIFVDDKKVDIASYQVSKDQVINLGSKALQIPYIKKIVEEKNVVIPAWLKRQGTVGKVLRLPERKEAEGNVQEQLIVEFYSR